MADQFNARPYVLHEANLAQLQELKPNLAVLPWGATEGHNYHLPHGTDVVEGTALGETIVRIGNEQGARAVLLPTVPFGNDNAQLRGQVSTITMRSSTQQMVLHDVAESLVRQGIHRLLVLNFHGGNEFKAMIRDVMLDLPIFIAQAHGFMSGEFKSLLDDPTGDHADEFETSLMLHLAPDWVAPLETAGDGAQAESHTPIMSKTPGVWYPRDWETLTESSGTGNPKAGTAEKGKIIFERFVEALVPVVVELSTVKTGQFPVVIRDYSLPMPDNGS